MILISGSRCKTRHERTTRYHFTLEINNISLHLFHSLECNDSVKFTICPTGGIGEVANAILCELISVIESI